MVGQCSRDATQLVAKASENSLPRSKSDGPVHRFGGHDMPAGAEDQWASQQFSH